MLFPRFAALVLVAVLVPLFALAQDKPSVTLAALKGHSEPVFSVAFSPDGRFLVSGSGDPSLKVWQLAPAKDLKTFAGTNSHKGIVLGVAVSPDGSQIATGGNDNSLKIWDFPGDKHLREFAHSADPRSVAVTSDGTKLAAGAIDGKIRVWNLADNKQLLEIAAHNGPVTGVGFSPNNATLASIGADSTLRLWNVGDGKAVGSAYAAHPGVVSSLAWAPGGNMIYTTGPEGTLRYWNLPATPARPLPAPLAENVAALALTPDVTQMVIGSGKTVRMATFANGNAIRDVTAPAVVSSVAVTTAGGLVAAASADRKLSLWQGKDGQLLMQEIAHAGGISNLAFNPGGNQLASVGKDAMLRLWAMPPIAPRVASHADTVRFAQLSADGKRLLTTSADKIVRLFAVANLKAVERQFSGHTAAVNAAVFSGDGKAVLSVGDDASLRVWNAANGEQTALLGAHEGAIVSLLALGGDRYLTGSLDGSIKLWQLPDPKAKATYAHAAAVGMITLSPDGSKVLSASGDKQVRMWNIATGTVERAWAGPTGNLAGIAISPRGDRVAAASADKTVTLWESATNKQLQKLTLTAEPRSVAFSADSLQSVVGSADGSIRVFDIAMGKETKALTAHKGAVVGLSVTPKGDQLVSAAADGVVLIQPLAGGATQTITHGSAITAMALKKDGTEVALGSADKKVTRYSLATTKAVASLTTPADVRAISYAPTGDRLAVAGADGKARLYAGDGNLEEIYSQEGAVNGVAFSADGKRVFSSGEDKAVRAWASSLLWQARHGAAVRQVILSPKVDRLWSAGEDGMVKAWNVADGKLAQTLRVHTGAVTGVSLSADTTRLATTGADKTARVFDLAKLASAKTGGATLDPALCTVTLSANGESISLSPDGKRLAIGVVVGGKEGVVLADAQTGKDLLTLGQEEAVGCRMVAWQADSRTLLCAGADKAARLLDVNLVGGFQAHEGGVSCVAFSNNGTQLVTGGADKTAKLWTFASGKLDRTFGPLAEPITAVNYSRDFTKIGVLGGKKLEIFNLADGKSVTALDLPSAATTFSFNNDSKLIATNHADGRLRVWDVASKREVQGFFGDGPIVEALFHPSLPNVVLGAAQKNVTVFTMNLARSVEVGSAVNSVVASPNSTHAIAACADGKIRMYNSGGVADRICDAGDKAQLAVAITKNNQLVAAGGADKKVRLFNYADGKKLGEFDTPSEPQTLRFAENNQVLMVGCKDGTIMARDVVWTPGQALPEGFGKMLQSYSHTKEVVDLAGGGPSGVFYSASADKFVKAWKPASDSPVRSFTLAGSGNAVLWNKDGSQVAVGTSDGKVVFFDSAKGTQLRSLTVHTGMEQKAIYSLAISPDGKSVVTASSDQTLKLSEVESGKLIREFKAYKEKEFEKGHRDSVLAVAFSPDGKQIVSGGMDKTVKIWDVASGTVVREMINPGFKIEMGQPPLAHPGWVNGVIWTASNKIVSAGNAPRLKGYLAIWDAGSGKMLSGRELDIGAIHGVAISADEKKIALATGGSVRAERDLNVIQVIEGLSK